jgi:hypothetical protein
MMGLTLFVLPGSLALLVRDFMFLLAAPLAVGLLLPWIVCHILLLFLVVDFSDYPLECTSSALLVNCYWT